MPIKFQRLTEQTKDLPKVSHLYGSVVPYVCLHTSAHLRHGQPGHSARATVRDVSHCPYMSASNKKEDRAGQRFTTAPWTCLSVEFWHCIKTPNRGLRRLVAGAWILSQISIYGNCGGQNGTRNVFLQVFRVFPFSVSFHGCPHSPITDNIQSQGRFYTNAQYLVIIKILFIHQLMQN